MPDMIYTDKVAWLRRYQESLRREKELAEEVERLQSEAARITPLLSGMPGGPVRLLVKWCFPSDGRHADGEWKTTKPDTDNLDKALKDEMTRLRYWYDDAQVASEISEKFWADVPGIFVKVVAL